MRLGEGKVIWEHQRIDAVDGRTKHAQSRKPSVCEVLVFAFCLGAPQAVYALNSDAEEVTASMRSTVSAQKLALGKSVFLGRCLRCHGDRELGAPKYGSLADWKNRISQGVDLLVQHALEGHGRMPPKGGFQGLTDQEVAAAATYVYHESRRLIEEEPEVLAQRDCDPVKKPDNCSRKELQRAMLLQMLWLLTGQKQ